MVKLLEHDWYSRYGFAIVTVIVATVIRSLLDPFLADKVPFGVFFISVMASAWYGGFGPSLLALGLGLLSACHFFIPPHDSLNVEDWADRFSLVTYFGVGVAMAYMNRSLRIARREAEAVAMDNAALNDALMLLDKRKDEFLATISHEMRNPLAPIRNVLTVLKQRNENSETLGMALPILERQVQCMVRLVDDLSDLSRIKNGKIALRKEAVDLENVLVRAVEMSQPLVDSKEHELVVSMPPEHIRIEADPVRMAQVIANLINNAAKYSNRASRIHVTVRLSDSKVSIEVRDNGIGIRQSDMSRIFTKFVQAEDGQDHAQGGLGIGLALVRSLVELHGGTIEVESAGIGQGSTFTVRLPVHTLAVEEKLLTIETATPVVRRRVLIVDDTADAADSLAMLLELDGHLTEVAYSGAAALQVADGFRPDLVLLDLEMPEMSGFDVVERLRQIKSLRDVTIVALTGWGQAEDRRRTEAAGFDRHLLKPIDLDELNEVLVGRRQPV